MTAMKASCSILFSIALIWTQIAFVAGAVPVEESAGCPKCRCEHGCCVQPAAPVAPATPVSPSVRPVVHEITLAVPARASVFLFAFRTFDPERVPVPAPLLHPAEVPLYDWNCSYLI